MQLRKGRHSLPQGVKKYIACCRRLRSIFVIYEDIYRINIREHNLARMLLHFGNFAAFILTVKRE